MVKQIIISFNELSDRFMFKSCFNLTLDRIQTMSRSSLDHVYVTLKSCFNHVEIVFPAHLTRNKSRHAQNVLSLCWQIVQFEQLSNKLFFRYIMLQSYLILFTFHVSVWVCVSQSLYLHCLYEFHRRIHMGFILFMLPFASVVFLVLKWSCGLWGYVCCCCCSFLLFLLRL